MKDIHIFLLRLCLFAGTHSLLALPQIKQSIINNNQARRRSYRLFYNVTSLVIFSWTMSAFRNTPVLYVVPGIWSLVMYLMQAVFLAILASCIRQTGTADFLGLPVYGNTDNHKSQLVTKGWYGIVRHPLYLFSLLFMICNPVITSRWITLTLFSLVYFFIGALIEERRLLCEFGESYQRYRQRVPFIIPSASVRSRNKSKTDN